MNDDLTVSERRVSKPQRGWIQTRSGQAFYPLVPKAKDVRLYDIAHSLAQKCRFNGHTHGVYTVAQHSIAVADMVPDEPGLKLAALLHDAAEAYLPDVASPIKPQCAFVLHGKTRSFAEVEAKVLDVIFEALGISQFRHLADSEEVKHADLVALATEKRELMWYPKPKVKWTLPVKAANYHPMPESSWGVRDRFVCLAECYRLAARIKGRGAKRAWRATSI